MNRGRETTTNNVFFSTRPKRFAAEQKYASESSLRTCKICKVLLLWYLTLPWGNWPDNFLHVITGAGCPVTWQVGRVKLLPSIAWWGPGWRETRGRTETKEILFVFFWANRIHLVCNKIFVSRFQRQKINENWILCRQTSWHLNDLMRSTWMTDEKMFCCFPWACFVYVIGLHAVQCGNN